MDIRDEMHPAQLDNLKSMLERNVFFYPPHLWDKAVEVEILDRGLVNRGDREHQAILLMVEDRKAGR